MSPTPEAEARIQIDAMLAACGWLVQDMAQANIHAGRGVALREFPLKAGYGFADYLLYVDGQAAGVTQPGVERRRHRIVFELGVAQARLGA